VWAVVVAALVLVVLVTFMVLVQQGGQSLQIPSSDVARVCAPVQTGGQVQQRTYHNLSGYCSRVMLAFAHFTSCTSSCSV
jgi:hypothetical protein